MERWARDSDCFFLFFNIWGRTGTNGPIGFEPQTWPGSSCGAGQAWCVQVQLWGRFRRSLSSCRPVDRPAAFPSFCFELVPVCWSRLPGSPTFETMFLHIYLRIDSKMMLHLLLVRLCFNSLKSWSEETEPGSSVSQLQILDLQILFNSHVDEISYFPLSI